MKHLVYKTYNPSTGEYYFGKHSTDNLNDGYQGSGNWIKESEKDTLVTEILDIVETELEAYELEDLIIELHIEDSLCMNLRAGGTWSESMIEKFMGRTPWNKGKTGCFSEDALRKMSEWQIGRTLSEETKRKMSESKKGHTCSLETRKKIGAAHKGKAISEEMKKHLSKIQGGLNDTQKKEVIEKYIPRKYSSRVLAKEYGVSHRTILNIVKK